jgi:septin family protein
MPVTLSWPPKTLYYGQVNTVSAWCTSQTISSSWWMVHVQDLLSVFCRIEKQAEQEQLECQAQQRRLLAEIHREKERLVEKETRMNQELEETKQNLSRESAKVIERLKQEHQETVEACKRRHQVGGIL